MAFYQGRAVKALGLTLLGALGTTLGGILMVLYPGMTLHQLGILQGFAAGLMICISFMDLLPDAVETIGFPKAHFALYLGATFFAMVTMLLPEPELESMLQDSNSSGSSDSKSKKLRREILLSGLITGAGIALHNFPEGASVFLAAMKSGTTGFNLALAVALHNIPEGVAVALPVYYATDSRWTGFKYAALSGLAEPLAVVIMALFMPLLDLELSEGLVDFAMASVAGIMAYISLHELLPLSLTHCGKTRMTISVMAGMALMSANLYLLHD